MIRTVSIDPEFSHWRNQARELLAEGVSPESILWTETTSGEGVTYHASPLPTARVRESDPISVPKSFLSVAAAAACHSDPERWGILYRLLWRMTRGGERQLLFVSTDPVVRRAAELAKEVQQDVHRMRDLVRFRKVAETESGREQFVSWYEPTHRIVVRNGPFFRKRYPDMDWSILTPGQCLHWDGVELQATPGISWEGTPTGEELETLWRDCCSGLFGASRQKPEALRSETPVKNLYLQNPDK